MKASIKFREEQKPLVRAKIPLNILGLPFQSGVVAGDSKELALNLASFFESGPSLKIAYRPNDSLNPFSLVFKIGIGHYGSPTSSPMTMSAEFKLIGSQNPSFFVHFRPQFGDFSLKKSQSSDFVKIVRQRSTGPGSGSDDESIEVIDTPLTKGGYSNGVFSSEKVAAVPSPEPSQKAATLFSGLLRGMEASARTSLPLMNRAVVHFRWGFRLPEEEVAATLRRDSIRKLPLLVMNKIGIEHMADDRPKESGEKDARVLQPAGDGDVLETCLAVKRQLEMLQTENGMLKKALDDLRYEFAGGKFQFAPSAASGERVWRAAGGEKKPSELEGYGGNSKKDGNLREELKK